MVDREYFAVYIVTVYIYVHASILKSLKFEVCLLPIFYYPA